MPLVQDSRLRETPIEPCAYLRKKGTDEIFAYSPYLAIRKDMEPYDSNITGDKEGEKLSEVSKSEGDANRILLILEAMNELKPDDFTSTFHLPKIDVLSKLTGLEVTKVERDEAWQLFQDRNKSS